METSDYKARLLYQFIHLYVPLLSFYVMYLSLNFTIMSI